MQRGYNSDEMIGDSFYAKYLTTKLRLKFLGRVIADSTDPLEMGQIVHPTHIDIYWGWCRPTNFNQLTVPNSANVSFEELQTHLATVVSPHFNEKVDQLGYKERSHSPYTLEGKRRVHLNRNAAIQKPQRHESQIPLLQVRRQRWQRYRSPVLVSKSRRWLPVYSHL